MSLEEVARRTVEGMVGKALLASSLALIMAGVGFIHNEFAGLHSEISAHSYKLATISQNIIDLTTAVRDHNTTTDAALDKLLDDDKVHAAAIATAEAELQDMRREPREMIEPSQRFTPVPQPLPAIGNAIQHLFNPPHRQWRRHP